MRKISKNKISREWEIINSGRTAEYVAMHACACLFALFSLTVRPEVEGSTFMAPCRDSGKSLTLDLYVICYWCCCWCLGIVFAAQHKSWLCVCVWACVWVWLCNQVNAFTKPLTIFSKKEALTTLLFLIQHATMYCICICVVCIWAAVWVAAYHKVDNAQTKRALLLRLSK